MAYGGGFQEHLLVPTFPFEHVQYTSFGGGAMMLDDVDEVLESMMDMGPDEHTTHHVPAVPVGGEGLAGSQNGMATLDTPAFQRTPQADFTPAAIHSHISSLRDKKSRIG